MDIPAQHDRLVSLPPVKFLEPRKRARQTIADHDADNQNEKCNSECHEFVTDTSVRVGVPRKGSGRRTAGAGAE